MKSGDSVPQYCDDCGQPADERELWKVGAGEYCYNCCNLVQADNWSNQVQDDVDDDRPTDATDIYLLLRNKLVVYVGITKRGDRMEQHWKKKGWHFNDMIETPDGPYNGAEAERREKILIPCFSPEYNQQHRFRRITKEEEREFFGWLSRWPEGNDAMCERIERLMRIDLALGTHAYPLLPNWKR